MQSLYRYMTAACTQSHIVLVHECSMTTYTYIPVHDDQTACDNGMQINIYTSMHTWHMYRWQCRIAACMPADIVPVHQCLHFTIMSTCCMMHAPKIKPQNLIHNLMIRVHPGPSRASFTIPGWDHEVIDTQGIIPPHRCDVASRLLSKCGKWSQNRLGFWPRLSHCCGRFRTNFWHR